MTRSFWRRCKFNTQQTRWVSSPCNWKFSPVSGRVLVRQNLLILIKPQKLQVRGNIIISRLFWFQVFQFVIKFYIQIKEIKESRIEYQAIAFVLIFHLGFRISFSYLLQAKTLKIIHIVALVRLNSASIFLIYRPYSIFRLIDSNIWWHSRLTLVIARRFRQFPQLKSEFPSWASCLWNLLILESLGVS